MLKYALEPDQLMRTITPVPDGAVCRATTMKFVRSESVQ